MRQEYPTEKIPNTETISRLCEVLDCQPGDIMEYVPAASNIKEPEPPKQSSDAVPQSDAPIHETLDAKLERLRKEHSTQAPTGSNE